MNKIYFFLIISIFFSCQTKTKKHVDSRKFGNINKSEIGELNKTYYFDSNAGTTIPVTLSKKYINIESIVDSISLLPLQTTDQALIGGIDKIAFIGGQFYILDKRKSKSLFVFDSNGNFIRTIGVAGRGPGEFIEPSDFTVSILRNEIVIFDHFGRQLLYYDLAGTFKNNVRLKYIISEFIPTNVDSIYIVKAGDNRHIEEIDNYELLTINQHGRILSRVLRNENRINFQNSYDYQNYDGVVLYHSVLSNEIYEIRDSSIRVRYNLSIPDGLPENFLERCKGNYGNFINQFDGKYNYFSEHFFETDDYLFVNITSKGERFPIHVYYDKRSGKTVSGIPAMQLSGHKKSFDMCGLVGYSMTNPTVVYENRIIGTISAAYLQELSYFPQEKKKWLPNIDTIDISSNPYIFTLKLR